MKGERTVRLHEKLRFVRKQKGMTLRQVADVIGKSVSFLSDIERGRTNPSLLTFYLLSIAYKQSMSQLMSGVNEVVNNYQNLKERRKDL